MIHILSKFILNLKVQERHKLDLPSFCRRDCHSLQLFERICSRINCHFVCWKHSSNKYSMEYEKMIISKEMINNQRNITNCREFEYVFRRFKVIIQEIWTARKLMSEWQKINRKRILMPDSKFHCQTLKWINQSMQLIDS